MIVEKRPPTPPGLKRPTVFGEPALTRGSAYCYVCRGCSRCCRNFRIQVNPYEIARLARHLSLSTTEFIARHLEDGPYLGHRTDGTCIFLGERGCSVHAARPLVCRLYPLGRRVTSTDDELFAHIQPHPESEGEYGDDGTVADYLAAQGAAPFIAAADRYLDVFRRLFAALQRNTASRDAEATMNVLRSHAGPQGAVPPELLDPDRTIRQQSVNPPPETLDPEAVMALHIAAIESWLNDHFEENQDEDKE
jgi:uncharacterized protein